MSSSSSSSSSSKFDRRTTLPRLVSRSILARQITALIVFTLFAFTSQFASAVSGEQAPIVAQKVIGNTLTITWSPVPGATGYTLYYAPYLDESVVQALDVGNITSASAPLPAGTSLYYAVVAYDESGTSPPSNVLQFEIASADIIIGTDNNAGFDAIIDMGQNNNIVIVSAFGNDYNGTNSQTNFQVYANFSGGETAIMTLERGRLQRLEFREARIYLRYGEDDNTIYELQIADQYRAEYYSSVHTREVINLDVSSARDFSPSGNIDLSRQALKLPADLSGQDQAAFLDQLLGLEETFDAINQGFRTISHVIPCSQAVVQFLAESWCESFEQAAETNLIAFEASEMAERVSNIVEELEAGIRRVKTTALRVYQDVLSPRVYYRVLGDNMLETLETIEASRGLPGCGPADRELGCLDTYPTVYDNGLKMQAYWTANAGADLSSLCPSEHLDVCSDSYVEGASPSNDVYNSNEPPPNTGRSDTAWYDVIDDLIEQSRNSNDDPVDSGTSGDSGSSGSEVGGGCTFIPFYGELCV